MQGKSAIFEHAQKHAPCFSSEWFLTFFENVLNLGYKLQLEGPWSSDLKLKKWLEARTQPSQG